MQKWHYSLNSLNSKLHGLYVYLINIDIHYFKRENTKRQTKMNSSNVLLPLFKQLPSFFTPIWFSSFFCKKKIYQHHWAGLSIQMMTSWKCVVSLIIWFQWMIWRSWFLTVWQEFVIPKSEMISALFLCCFVTISIQDELSPWWEFLDAAKWCQSFGRR